MQYILNGTLVPAGAGKTYTMLGTDAEPGMMVLTLNDLFHRMEETKEDIIYRTTIAYLEVLEVNSPVACMHLIAWCIA